MQPVRRQTLIGQVTEQLREEILSGRWAIGARIPTEPELCELTGTSRNTIREAVQALAHAGMLERRQGSGTYVLSVGGSGSAIADYFANRGIPGALFVCAAESKHHRSLSRFFPANMLEVH